MVTNVFKTSNRVDVVCCSDCRYGQFFSFNGIQMIKCSMWDDNMFHNVDFYCADGERNEKED